MRSRQADGEAAGEVFLYERLADELGGMVERGALKSGERLPSVRRLAEDRGVSIATVLAAYLLLEGRGVAEARPKSGHFVRARRTANPPVPSVPRRAPAPARVSIAAGADDLIRAMTQGRGLVPLGTAYVAAELLPLRKLNAALAAVAREGGGPGGGYDELRGTLQLRRQLARRAVAWGAFLEEDDFVTTAGATEALNLSLRAVTKPGDIIAVESPAYFGLLRLVDVLGLRAIEIPSDPRTGLELDALEDAVRSAPVRAVLATPNFSNPLGARMPDSHKERLVKMLTRREIPLVEDDVYGDLAFDGTRPRPAKAFDTEGLVLLCGSISKTLAPGYRVGFVAPGRFRDAGREAEVRLQRLVADADADGGRRVPRRGRLRASPPATAARARRAVRALSRGDRAPLSRGHARLAPAGRLRRVGRARRRGQARQRRRPPAASARQGHRDRAGHHFFGSPALRQLHTDQHGPSVDAAHRARDRDARSARARIGGDRELTQARRRRAQERLDRGQERRVERARKREEHILRAFDLTLRRLAGPTCRHELLERDAQELVRGPTDAEHPAHEAHATSFGRGTPNARRPQRARCREARTIEHALDVRRGEHRLREQVLGHGRKLRHVVEERERTNRCRIATRHEAHHAERDLVDVALLEQRRERALLGVNDRLARLEELRDGSGGLGVELRDRRHRHRARRRERHRLRRQRGRGGHGRRLGTQLADLGLVRRLAHRTRREIGRRQRIEVERHERNRRARKRGNEASRSLQTRRHRRRHGRGHGRSDRRRDEIRAALLRIRIARRNGAARRGEREAEPHEQLAECLTQLAHVRVAIRGLLRERLHRDRIDARIEPGAALRRVERRHEQMLAEESLRVVGDERRLAGDELVEHRAASVDVAALVERLAEALLGRHVRGRSGDRRRAALGHSADHAEVAELHLLVLFAVVVRAAHEDHVRRLHVAVDDVVLVSVREARGDLEHELRRVLDRKAARALEEARELGALEQLHREPERAVGFLTEVEDAYEVRVIEHARGAPFRVEARADHGVLLERAVEDLDRDGLGEMKMACAIDSAERALADA